MTDCRDFADHLGAFADGETVPPETAAHVAACAACRAEVESYARIDRLVRMAADAPPPSWESVRRAMTPRRVGMGPALATAAAALLALAAIFLAYRPVDADARLAEYFASPTPDRADAVVALGTPALDAILPALLDPDARRRGLAASLLPRFDVAEVERRLEAMPQETGGEDLLAGDWGGDEVQVREVLIRWTQEGRMKEYAIRELAGVDYLALLQSGDADAQRHAMDVAREIPVRLRIDRVIELIDVPELREQAVGVLRRVSQADFGADKEAWRRWWRDRQGEGCGESDRLGWG